jgi:diadenylate cyclase
MRKGKFISDAFSETLNLLAPGTPFQEGLENILRARTGALIVAGDGEEVLELINGGFKIDTDLNPSNLYELAKMDGAIILNREAKRILYANAQLIPNPLIPSYETGIRHRTAERVAKQTGELVIAISQRRNLITLYKGNSKYVLRDLSVILTKANQAIQTLEKYRSVFDEALKNLSALEFEDLVTLFDVATVIQRCEMVERIACEIERYICELGVEGRLIRMQLDELMVNVEEEGLFVIKDYWKMQEGRSPENIKEQIGSWSSEDLLDLTLITRAIGYGGALNTLDTPVKPRGYRILSKIARLPMPVIEHLIETFKELQRVMNASLEELDAVEGIGETRAMTIKDCLKRMKDHILLDRPV